MADYQYSNNDEIKLTREELYRLKNAFQNENFLKLFQDYIEDINSVESRRKYEEEIILLEKERGYDVKFIHPEPSYVIKFSSNEVKSFINICKNQYVGEARHERGDGGIHWKIPVILSKPRDDSDKKGAKCKVYDIMFHPKTIDLAFKDRRFRCIIEDTAVSTIYENFGITMNVKVAKYPRMKYKGKPPHVVLRHKKGNIGISVTCESFEEYWKKHIKSITKTKEEIPPLHYQIPKYEIRYRDIIDMKDFSLKGYTDKCAPKEIIIEIILPGVQKTTDIELDVFDRKLSLRSCQNLKHHYLLNLNFSYAINSKGGKAKFDKSISKLIVELPVKDRGIPLITYESETTNKYN